MESKLRQEYVQNGFALCKNILTKEEVAEIRSWVVDFYKKPPQYPGDRNNIRFEWVTRYPFLRKIVTHPKFVSAMKEVLGDDYLILPSSSIHDSCLLGSWHRDTGTQVKAGTKFHLDPDYKAATVAIYLQDNHPEYGGGLDIVPGSHRTHPTWWQRQKSANSKLKFVLSHLDRRHLIPKSIVNGRKGAYTIPSKAGDILIFHTHCDHRPTHPTKDRVPDSHRKLALFLVASENTPCARKLVDFFRVRPDYVYMKDYGYPKEFLQDVGPLKPHFYEDAPIAENSGR